MSRCLKIEETGFHLYFFQLNK